MKLPALIACLLGTALVTLAADVKKITGAEAARLVAEGKAVLVDVREAPEYAETGVAASAVLLPKSVIDKDRKAWADFVARNKDKQIITYCRSGGRAAAVAGSACDLGANAVSAGGLRDLTAAGMPTRKAGEPAKPAHKK